MLKKTITYENPLTEETVAEDHYFHISKTDLVKMEMEEHGFSYTKGGTKLTGMQAKLQKMLDSEDGKAILVEFEDFVRRSYGLKDGDRFRKSPEIAAEFMSSPAYDQFFWDLCTNAEAMSEFINGIIPKNLDQIAAEVREQAERQMKGLEAQEKAKANAGASQPAAAPTPAAAAVERAAIEEGAVSHDSRTLAERIENATPENPAVLTAAEVAELDGDELKSGLATGRIKIT